MSTFAAVDLGSDSDPEDGDFRPTAPKKRKLNSKTKAKKGSATASGSDVTDSDSGSSEDEDDVGEGSCAVDGVQVEVEAEERRRKAEEAFRALREEVIVKDYQPGDAGQGKKEAIEVIEVKRARRFAGETIFEIVHLPANDPEAVAYLEKPSQVKDPASLDIPALSATLDIPAATPPPSEPTPSIPAKPIIKPKPRGPIRKKPRQSLEQMASALDKGKKMTTLEKSQMDWKNHTSSTANLADELAANRRSGGQLGNREFLDRVGERRAGGATGSGKR